MVNTQLLDEKIKESGITKKHICKELGQSPQAFWKKSHNINNFRAAEIYVIADLTRMTSEEKKNIFFADELQQSVTERKGQWQEYV